MVVEEVGEREGRVLGGIGIYHVLFEYVLFHVARVRAVRGFHVQGVLLFVRIGDDVLLLILTLKLIQIVSSI